MRVVNFDALTYAGNPDNLADVAGDPRYRFVHGDITDREAVRCGLRTGVDAIVHFAAESHVDRSIHDSRRRSCAPTCLGTQVLLDAAREFKVGRFVQVSTDEVYGSLGPTGFFTEETPLAPNSPYAASKAAADLLVRSYVHTFGLPAVITRCSNNYGPYQFPEKLIPLFITNLLRDEPVPVYGDGLNMSRLDPRPRSLCGLLTRCCAGEGLARCTTSAAAARKTNLELTHALLEVVGKPASLIRYVPDRLGHDRRYAIDCSKIEKELGWRPIVPFEEGLRQTVEWYKRRGEPKS